MIDSLSSGDMDTLLMECREKLDAVYGDGGQDSAIEPLLSSAQARSLAKEKW